MEGLQALSYSAYKHTDRSIPDSENMFLIGCKEVDTWFLMGSPWPVISIVAAYLLFVLKIGPEYMKDKAPINIKLIILIYNLYQTFYNGYLTISLFKVDGAISYLWKYGCHPMDPAINPYVPYLNQSAWLFFFSKVADLLDTVFFILRKKQSHVTFLHVYHHANMVMSTWLYLKYIKGEQGVIVGWINALVHTVMYSYYFLSALGPQVQKYLWWKKYITRMQMFQFVLVFMYTSSLLMFRCELPKLFTGFLLVQAVTFFILFLNFYVKSYVSSKKVDDVVISIMKNNNHKDQKTS